MSRKNEIITLDCGVEAESWFYAGEEHLQISLIDLYNGYGKLASLKLMAKLFTELSEKGFASNGISRIEGYYNSTDDLLLKVTRKKI